MLGWIASKLTGDAVGVVAKGIGNGISNVMDRFWPKKMNEEEKWGKMKDMMSFEIEQGKLEIADVNKAREMYMAEVRSQPQPWIARLMNSTYRPFCGFIAVLYLTDQLWSQILTNLIPNFNWTLIVRDPIVDSLVAVIIYFFFGYRQRSKEKGIVNKN